jgi:uncharacterized protein HemX
MKFSAKSPDGNIGQAHEVGDPVLDQALRNFRSSVHAWSEAVYCQPHQVVPVHIVSWRGISAWALALVLAVGIAVGGFYGHNHRQSGTAAADAAQTRKPAESQPVMSEANPRTTAVPAVAEPVRSDNEELAKVDSDVSRMVPTAMEPLAQMMTVDESE